MKNIIIEKRKFLAYEKVRVSGKTNMFDVAKVERYARKEGVTLTRSEIFDIMQNYSSYKEKFLD